MTKRTWWKAGLAAVVSVFLVGFASAEEEGVLDGVLEALKLEASGDLSFSSVYMWRGIMLDGDPVVQPGLYVSTRDAKWGKLKVGFWASRDLTNRDALRSAETDVLLDYTYQMDKVSFSAGHTYYDFPDAAPADGAAKAFSREVYAGIGLASWFLSPSVYYYYDYGRKEDGGGAGSYTVLNLSHSVPFSVKKLSCSLDLSGHVGHNNKQYYRGKGGDAGISAGVSIPLTKKASIKPTVNYSVPWGNLSDKGNGNQEDRFFTGLYISWTL